MMQTEIEKNEIFLCTCDCKLKWFGYGEWVEEADKITFHHMGYECMVHRVFAPELLQKDVVFGGHLCGYVKIPNDHVYYQEKNAESIHLLCHGGVSYNATNEDGVQAHWVGFDCAHAGDCIPSVEYFKHTSGKIESRNMKEILEKYPHFKATYKNMGFCVKQCISMVDQLIEIQDEYKKKSN